MSNIIADFFAATQQPERMEGYDDIPTPTMTLGEADLDSTSKVTSSPGFWSSAFDFAGNLVNNFNYKGQANQVAIAEANRDALLAQQKGLSSTKPDNTVLYVLIAVVVLGVVLLIAKRK